MGQTEHVSGFMREHLAASAQQENVVSGRARFTVKGRIVAGEAINTNAVAERCLSENEIPGRLGVKIFHRDRQNAESVRGKAARQKGKDIAGKNLLVAGNGIAAGLEFGGLN